MKKKLSYLLLIIGALAVFACSDGIDYEKMRQEELALLDEYMSNVHPGAEATATGLYYFNEPGTGEGDTIKAGDRVQLFYATWALNKADDGYDSTLVDETNGYLDGHKYEPYQLTVGAGSSISGLEEALLYMQPGTKSHLVINSALAYGQQGSGFAVGPFQTVLMEVEVYKVIPFNVNTEE